MRIGLALLAGVVGILGVSGANAAWQEASSKHFVVYADEASDKLRTFTTRLERFDAAARAMRGLPDPALSPTQRVTVYVLDDVGDVAKLNGRGGSDIAGFYNPRASGPVAFVPRHGTGDGQFALSSQAVLLHEYSHHLMYSTMGGYVYPPWLVEGFAEFNATAVFEDDGAVSFGAVPMYRIWGLAAGPYMSAKVLLNADPARLASGLRDAMYGRGWLLTHYLMTDAGRRAQLSDYLKAINSGRSPAEAAEVLGGIETIDHQLEAYTHQRRMTGFRVPAKLVTVGNIALRPLTPGEEAVMPARLMSTRGVDAKSAPRVVALARRLAAPYPTDAAAQNELPEAELDGGDPQASLAAAQRALATDPRSLHAMEYRRLALQAIASKSAGSDPAAWKSSRSAFIAANHLDNDAPYPLELNYLSYLSAGQKPTRNAENGLLQAAALAPYDDELALLAARVMLTRDKLVDAAGYLKPVAYNPHAGAAAELASKALSLCEAGDKPAALALLSPKRAADKDAKAAEK